MFAFQRASAAVLIAIGAIARVFTASKQYYRKQITRGTGTRRKEAVTDGFRMAGWGVAALCLGVSAPLVLAQGSYPNKPVRIVVPSAAGGPPDTLARLIGPKMSESWGQPVVIENRAGAGSMIGTSVVAKAMPDGYTLLLNTGAFAVNAALQPNLPYDPLKDFAGVSRISFGTLALVVPPALGVKSVKDFVEFGKGQPGKILFGSAGAASFAHLWGEAVRLAAGIKAVHVGFKGQPEAAIEVLAGRVHYAVLNLIVVLPMIKDGKLLALAVNSPQRSALLPDVPTMAETLPKLKGPDGGMGVLAPARTPHPIRSQISKEIARILDRPDIKERLQAMGVAPVSSTPDEHDKFLRAQIETVSKLVVAAGLKAK